MLRFQASAQHALQTPQGIKSSAPDALVERPMRAAVASSQLITPLTLATSLPFSLLASASARVLRSIVLRFCVLLIAILRSLIATIRCLRSPHLAFKGLRSPKDAIYCMREDQSCPHCTCHFLHAAIFCMLPERYSCSSSQGHSDTKTLRAQRHRILWKCQMH